LADGVYEIRVFKDELKLIKAYQKFY